MKQLLTYTLLIALFISCKKEKTPEPEEPATPVRNLSGKVYQYDAFGVLYTQSLNTTTVSVEGQSFSTVTDASGNFTIPGVPSNTYTLVFQKPGCGTIELQDVHFSVSDSTTYRAEIADLPTFTLTNAYAKDSTWFNSNFRGIFYSAGAVPFNQKASIVAIVGKSPYLDLSNPRSYLNYPVTSLADSVDFNRFLSYSLLKDTYTFRKDSTLYVKIYPVATKGSSYLDNKSGTLIYTAYGSPYPSVFSLIVQ